MTEMDLKYQDLKGKYEFLKEENKRLRADISMLTKELARRVDIRVESIGQVDLSDLAVPVAAVHVNCLEYPRKTIVRIFDMDKPTNVVIVKDTLEEIQKDIQKNTTMVFIQRGADDVESLVGVWVQK